MLSVRKNDPGSGLAELRRSFSKKLPKRIKEIEKSAERLYGCKTEEELVCAKACLVEITHRLAGAAGTFGYSKISGLAQRLEIICRINEIGPKDCNILSIVKRLKDAAKDGPEKSVTELPLVSASQPSRNLLKQAQRPILLIEDDVLIAQEIKRQLSVFGFSVKHLIEPQMLVEAIKHVKAEAIIMDIRFPKADDAGIVTVKKLRELGSIKCPVIYLSVLDDFATRLKAVHSGCDAYLVKPIDPIELVDILNRMPLHLNRSPLQVLIIDDCSETAEYYAIVLNKRGIASRVETDPMNVMETLKSFHPDLVLIDINMPKCNGIDLSSVIRQHREFLQIPIVFMTARPSLNKRMRSLRAGGDGFLVKPIEPEVLITAIAPRAERFRHLKTLMAHVEESEARFRDLAEGAKQGIVIHRQFKALFANKALAKIFGYDGPEGILSLDTLLDLREPREHNKHKKFMTARMSNDSAPTIYESKGVRKNGEIIWTENHVRIVDWGGRKATQTTIIDITERKNAEKDLRKMSRRNQLILDTAGEGIFGINKDEEFIFINPAAAKMLNINPEEVIGKRYKDFINHRKMNDENSPMSILPWDDKHGLAIKAHSNNEVFCRNDGSCFPVEYVATPIQDADDDITGAVCVFRDVSLIREAQFQLMHVSKLASLGEMASGMAHEINQPLNIIRMMTENAIDEIADGTVTNKTFVKKLTKISEQTERAAAIIDHMRIFGRKSDGNLEPISLTNTVNDTANFISEQCRLNEIDLLCDFPDTCRLVIGNRVQLEQVLINILSNASDAIEAQRPKGGFERGSILLKIEDDPPCEQVVLFISDNGGGIPKEIIKRIFDPFFTTKGVGEGMGLGLSISHGIMKSMGGSLSAINQHEGAEFAIRLPAEDGASDKLIPRSSLFSGR